MKFGLTKETKIALLTIVSGTMLYTGFNFLKGSDTFTNINYYPVFYKNVDGLVAGNPVYVNGLSVGQVKDLELGLDNRVKVILQVDGKIPLTDSTRAKLIDGSLLGGKSIVLEIKPSKVILEDGDTISSYIEPGMSEALMQKAQPIISGVDKTLTNVNNLINEENQRKISRMLANMEMLTANTNDIMVANKQAIAASFSNMNKLTTSLVETEKQLKPILSNLNALSDTLKDVKLKATVDQANKTMADLDETINKINKGNGSMGKLINEDSLYVHLDKTVKDLDKLFIDLKEHPKRYVHFSLFGKKE